MGNIAVSIQNCTDHIIDEIQELLEQGRVELLNLPAPKFSTLNEPTIRQFLYKKIQEKVNKKIIHQIK